MIAEVPRHSETCKLNISLGLDVMPSFNNSLDSVLTNVASARGLPNEHYISADVFAEEGQAIFLNNWAGVAFGKDVPAPGDVKPITFLGMPLLLVRDRDGDIGVFQNTCRHRGMILVQEAGNIRSVIRCPYHSWCYSLKGQLKATPHVGGPGIDTHEKIKPDDLGLLRIATAVWHDVIFINLSGTAPAFEVYAADLISRWSDFEQPMVHGGADSSTELHVNTNWKLAVENYCESYHLPWIHPDLNTYSKLEDHYNIEQAGSFSGQGTQVYQQLKNENGHAFPDFNNIGQQWNTGAEYIALYPNVLFGTHRDHFFAIILEPLGTDKTIEHIELYYTEEGAQSQAFADLRKTNGQQWKQVFSEDIFVVEGMQAGRHGALFDGGKFSPVMDGPTHNFHHWVASQVHRGRSAS